VQLASAMTTPEQTGKQGCPPTEGAAAHGVLAGCIIRDQALVPLIVLPAEITLMSVRDQNVPVLALLPEPPHNLFASIGNADTASRASEGVSAA